MISFGYFRGSIVMHGICDESTIHSGSAAGWGYAYWGSRCRLDGNSFLLLRAIRVVRSRKTKEKKGKEERRRGEENEES